MREQDMEHPKQDKPMRITTQPGQCVEYMDCNGWPGDKEHCRRAGLVKGAVYEVVDIDVGSSITHIMLRGFRGRFNTVCFCNTRRKPKRSAVNGESKHG